MSFLQSASALHGSQHQNGSARTDGSGRRAMTAEDEASKRQQRQQQQQQQQKKSVAGRGEGTTTTTTTTTLSPLSPLIRLIRDPAGAVASVVEGFRDQAGAEERAEKLRIEGRRQILRAKLKNAATYHDWRLSAEELDVIEGNVLWKADADSPDYNAALVEARLRQLDDARASGNVDKMLFLVRTSLTRDLGDMGNIKLYRHSHIGTKDLIERYINSALDTLRALLSCSPGDLPPSLDSKRILSRVLSTRQAFGRSALLLSGGATFGMYHVGVIKALWENNLLPRIISGASAGSIVSSILRVREGRGRGDDAAAAGEVLEDRSLVRHLASHQGHEGSPGRHDLSRGLQPDPADPEHLRVQRESVRTTQTPELRDGT
ncbi:hypothetical protein GP486_008341 [Trichoglossum hirsutum]|uniref:PNPLA domain-containing protein n=1 Tax=Trichoglossum hirsutum TaxID=265104 RepID=A0A9P8IA68_9PEZI|nr:hypothetical protein GP486_008341 [Trichoglossum hirsutum]